MSAALATPPEPKERDQPRAAQQVQPAARADRGQPATGRVPEAPRPDPRQFEARAEEQRRAMQQEQSAHNADAFRRNGRLTPDERRDLRRQINEAGQDIYPNAPRR